MATVCPSFLPVGQLVSYPNFCGTMAKYSDVRMKFEEDEHEGDDHRPVHGVAHALRASLA